MPTGQHLWNNEAAAIQKVGVDCQGYAMYESLAFVKVRVEPLIRL